MIRLATSEDLKTLAGLYTAIGRSQDGYFQECLNKGCDILIAEENAEIVGSAVINWEPKYALYKKLDIPEIQDVYVVETARRKGCATAMVLFFEQRAKEKAHTQTGISVGLSKEYGPAQRLYFKLGYEPDGSGVTYDRGPTERYRSYPLDDDLCLMMVKNL